MKEATISGGLAMESSTTIVPANSQAVSASDSSIDWTGVPAEAAYQSQDTASEPCVSVAVGDDETAQEPVTLQHPQVGKRVDESRQFLKLLGKDPKAAWFRCLRVAPSGGTGKDLHGYSSIALQDRISKGQNVFLVVGEATTASGKRGGVQDVDITTVPALFVEWDDGASIEEQMQRWQTFNLPEPSVMVSTGGKSVHCYWVLQEPISAAEWKRITARLIAHFNSDANCSNPARMMRLPGSVYYDKKTGEATGQCRILSSAGTRYSAAEVEACLPAPKPAKPVTAAPSRDLAPRSIDEINAAAEYIPRRVGGEGTYKDDWHAICGCSAAFDEAGHPDPDGAALALLGHKWPDDTAKQALKTGKTRESKSFWAIAGQHGYDLKRKSRDKSPTAKPISKPEPRTFEQNWELLELHAAELACSTWPVMKAVASMAVKASELEIPRLGQRQLEQLLEQAQRRIRAKTEPVLGGGVFTIKATPWAVEGIFRHGLNLLTGQSGAGKSRLAAACMAAWLRGDATWLQRKLHGDDPRHRHALIIGTDQNLEDWHLTLGPVGLTTKLSATEVQVHERLTIYSLETGIQLDADGLNVIRRWVDAHPGGMVLIDSLAQCLPPGVDEDKSSAARPVHQLQEVLGDAWGILTHHTRKGAGKEGNLGVGAGRGSGAIDAAVSRVVGLGLIYRMENGQMVAQESDPRRELLSTKRGGKTEHLIVSSDGSGFWDVHGTAEALKAQERQQRVISNLTEAQIDVLAVVEAADGWITPRDVVESLGEEYDATNGKAATVRKLLKRLEVFGLVETQRVGNERTYRATEQLSQREVDKKGSTCSVIAVQGVSLAQQLAQPCSVKATEQPEQPEQPEPAEQAAEPTAEQLKSTAAEGLSKLSHHPRSVVAGVAPAPATIPGFIDPSPAPVGSGADVMDDGDDPHWKPRAA